MGCILRLHDRRAPKPGGRWKRVDTGSPPVTSLSPNPHGTAVVTWQGPGRPDAADVIYVLHAFQKKSKKGIATPPQEIDKVKARLKRAEEEYQAWKRKKP
ncbi:MAG: hypothetical protein EOR33_28680 [Mesorhizobium sp.]|nr:MAG: hypothetical protein EOR33_28680 [Mesorhizobium sp.]